MPSVVVDSVLVEAGWDPSALERGLARSERLVQEFATAHPTISLTVNGQDVVRQVEQIRQTVKAAAQTAPVVIPTVVSPPAGPPPDFSATILAAEKAAKNIRAAFINALDASGVMEHSGIAAGVAAVRGLEVGALSNLRGLGKKVAAGLLSPTDATVQADLIITTLKAEIQARQGELQALVNQARQRALGTGPNVSGVTTARSGGFVDKAELDAAEKAFDRLTGASELTNQAFVRVGSSSSAMRLGVRQAANSLSILAAQSIGTTGTVGRLAESVVLLGSGFSGAEGKIGALVGKVGIAAGVVLALAKAYEFLNTAQREAQKTQDDLVAGLLTEANSMSAAEKAARGLAAALQAKAEAESFGRRTSDLLKGAGLEAVGLPGAGAEFVRRQQQEVANATKAVTQAQKDEVKAFTDTNAAEVAGLTEGITLRIATTKEIQRATDFLPILKRLSADTNLPLVERIAFLKEITGLQAALATAPSAAPGDAVIVALGRQVAVLQIGEAAVRRLEAAQAALFAGQQKGVGVLDAVRVRLEQQKKAAELIKAVFLEMTLLRPTEILSKQFLLKPKIDGTELRAGLLAEVGRELGVIKDDAQQIEFERAAASAETLENVLRGMTLTLKEVGNANITKPFSDARTAAQKFNDGIHEITRSLDGVVAAANNIGLIGDAAANAVGSMLSLGDAIGNVVEKASAANIIGVVGAGLGAIGSIGSALGIGKSADQKAAEQALHENTQALRDAAVKFSQGFQGIGGAASAADILRQVVSSAAGQANISQTQEGGDTGRAARNALVDQLAQAGLGFKDLQRLAKEFGITILERGKLVGGALEQLIEAIRLATEAASHFGTTFSEEISFADLTARITNGVGDAVDQFQRDLKVAGQVTAPFDPTGFIQHFFDGIDIRGDSAAFQKRLQELLKLFAPGSDFFIKHPEFLGGLTVEDWKQILNDGAGAMEFLRDKTNQAAKSLSDLNVPTGFRRAAIAFQTGDAGPDIDRIKAVVQAAADAAAAAAAATAAAAAAAPTTTTPAIPPLPDDIQKLLDRIATKTPPDLLGAVSRVGDLIVAARQGSVPTAGVNATAPAALFTSAPRSQTVTVTIEGGLNVTITGEHQDPERMANDFFAALRRKALTQSGDTLQFNVR